MSIVSDAYESFDLIASSLDQQIEISARIFLEALAAKTLLLTAASYFESILIQAISDLSRAHSDQLAVFVDKHALERQYHRLFDWKTSNANVFLRLFGPAFEGLCRDRFVDETIEDSDSSFDKAMADFMFLGTQRNNLVHKNFGAFSLDLTRAEVLTKFKNADLFVNSIIRSLHSLKPPTPPAPIS